MRMLTFANRNTKEILRDPLTLIFGLGFPFVLILLLSAIQANIPVGLFEIQHAEADEIMDFANPEDVVIRLSHYWLDDLMSIHVQSSIEAHANGLGGRVRLSRIIREGLESSVQKHFAGELINCMSNANDMVYHCHDSNLMRSSNDFFPDQPLSHSKHVYCNAVNSIWLGQFVWCDWDMFQTGHPYGAYHAAARAISGGPIYVSDRVDEHDFDLIRSLTDRNGKNLRSMNVAMPTLDCLFADPRKDQSLYKIFNQNAFGSVVGVFSFGGEMCTTTVSPSDVPGNGNGRYALHSHRTGKNIVLTYDEIWDISLERVDFDIITISKIEDGVAVIGLQEKLNCGAAVQEITRCAEGLHLQIADQGQLLIYTEKTGFQTICVPPSGEE